MRKAAIIHILLPGHFFSEMSGSDPFERSPLLPQAVIEEEGEVRAIGVAEDDSTNQLRRSKWRLLWQKARRKATVFLWRTSESERKRQKLRRSHIGAAAFLIRDAVLGAYHPVDDPAAVMVEGGMTAVYDPHDYHHHHHPDDDETTAANCFVFFHATFCLWCRRWCNHWTLWYLLHCTMTCLILLTFVEPPHWCRDYYQENIVRENGGPKIAQPGGGGCEALLTATGPPATTSTNDNSMAVDVDYYYPNAGTGLWLTVPQSQVTETILLVVIATILLVRIGRDGLSLRRYLRRSPVRTNRVTQLFCLLALATGLALEQGSHPNLVALKYTAQYHAYFRLFLLFSFLGRSQREIRVLIDMLPVSLVMVATPFCCCFGFWFYLLQLTFFCVGRALSLLFVVRQEVFKILVLLCVITLFYAFFGIVVFVGTAEGAQHFSNLVEAVWTLLICVTTANYLDVAMPGYKENRWVALYFVTFMIISYFFLMNVILASVVNEYDTAVLEHRRKHEEMSTLNLQNAFRLLTLAEDEENSGLLPDRGDIPIREKTIDRQTILDLFFILNNDFPEFRHLSDDDAKLLFAILDRDGSSMISEEEFMDFGNVLLQAFSKTSDYTTFLEMHYPRFFHSDGWQRFGRIIKSTSFDHAMDLILAMNALVVTIQTWPELSGQVVALDSKYYYGIIDTFWGKYFW